MRIVPQVAVAMQAVFGTTLNYLSRTTGCVQRQRKFCGMSLVRTLVLTLLQHPAAKDRDYRAMAAKLGVQVTEEAIARRFTDSLVRFLEEVAQAGGRPSAGSEAVPAGFVAEVHGRADR